LIDLGLDRGGEVTDRPCEEPQDQRSLAIENSGPFEFNPFLAAFLATFFTAFFATFLAAFLAGGIDDVVHVAVVFQAVLVGVLFGGGEVGDFGGVEEFVEDAFLEGLGAIAEFG
jgi:hypothetical protein